MDTHIGHVITPHMNECALRILLARVNKGEEIVEIAYTHVQTLFVKKYDMHKIKHHKINYICQYTYTQP